MQCAQPRPVDVPLSNHPGYDGTVAKLKARATAAPGSNPFVSGQPVVDRAMRVLNTCARAQKTRFMLMALGGTGPLHALATDVQGPIDAHPEDDDHVRAGLLALGNSHNSLPTAFPFSIIAAAPLGLQVTR